MTESLFDIFGDRLTKESTRSLLRQPLSNNENIGKGVALGPVKPNEPLKKAGEMKKSFLSNTCKALREIQTPVQRVYSPKCRNTESSTTKLPGSQRIYSEEFDDEAKQFYEAMEFTRPAYKYDNYFTDFMLDPEPKVLDLPSPSTPPPVTVQRSMELDCSYEDDFFKDDFMTDCKSYSFEQDGFPPLYEDSD